VRRWLGYAFRAGAALLAILLLLMDLAQLPGWLNAEVEAVGGVWIFRAVALVVAVLLSLMALGPARANEWLGHVRELRLAAPPTPAIPARQGADGARTAASV